MDLRPDNPAQTLESVKPPQPQSAFRSNSSVTRTTAPGQIPSYRRRANSTPDKSFLLWNQNRIQVPLQFPTAERPSACSASASRCLSRSSGGTPNFRIPPIRSCIQCPPRKRRVFLCLKRELQSRHNSLRSASELRLAMSPIPTNEQIRSGEIERVEPQARTRIQFARLSPHGSLSRILAFFAVRKIHTYR